MARTTVYNHITTPELIDEICEFNKELIADFLDYLKSVDRAKSTINQYKADLNVFFCWNLQNNKNKRFIDITKREIARFQNHALTTWNWSSSRVRRVKSVISSLSNFIEAILDEEEEFEGYRAIVRKIENPVNETVREKTIFETEELQHLLDVLVSEKKYQQACMLALCMASGRRKSELPRFKVSYFDEENIIFGSMYKTPEKVQTKGRGHSGKKINLYVLKNQFDPYLKLWMDEREKNDIKSEWLFPNPSDENEQMNVSTMNAWARRFSDITGKDFYWHSLRHYFTTELAKSNIPSSVIQEIVGWESADMVNLYTDLTADDMIGKYFDENGIKNVEQKRLEEI